MILRTLKRHDQHGLAVADIVRDARYGLRSLRRAPGVTLVAIVSLGIAIGVAASVFAVAHGLYLRRLPVPHPEQLVTVEQGGRRVNVPYTGLRALVDAPGVPPLAGYRLDPARVETETERGANPEWIDMVSGGYFGLLRTRPLLGRTITLADEQEHAAVAVISDHFRRAHFADGVNPVGRTLRVNELTLTIIGVMPPDFQGIHFARQFEIAAPITLSTLGFPDIHPFATHLIGRLPDERTRVSATAAVQAALRHCCLELIGPPDGPPRTAAIIDVPPDDGPFGDIGQWFNPGRGAARITLGDASRGVAWGADYRGRYARLIAIGVAGALLLVLVGCANVATLLAARGEQREREFAIRLSLGASRGRLARQLLVEAGALAAAGGVLGVALAVVLSRSVVRILGLSSAAGHGTLVDWSRAQNFALPACLVLLCAVVVSVWPARRAARANLVPAISGERRHGMLHVTFERALVVIQGASAIVLASTALLFVTTVDALMDADGGYRSPSILLARVEVRDAFCTGSRFASDIDRCNAVKGQDRQRLVRFEELIGALEKVHGVRSAALASTAPVIQDQTFLASLRIGDNAGVPTGTRFSVVGTGFFTATGIGLVAGRDFLPSDEATAGGERDVIISASTARRYYPGGSAVGRVIEEETRAGPERLRVIGVARDAKFDPMTGVTSELRRDETDMVYLPLAQFPHVPTALSIVIRTSADPVRVQPAVGLVLRGARGITPLQLVPLQQLLQEGSARERVSAALFSGAGGVSLALVAVALFAVLQYAVQCRTREFGIRMALGARRADVLVLVMRDAIGGGAIAVVLGLPAALAAHQMLRAELFGIGPGDPRVLITVAATVLLLAAAAGLLPATRAASVDPLVSIKGE